jgi:hypothetical protein
MCTPVKSTVRTEAPVKEAKAVILIRKACLDRSKSYPLPLATSGGEPTKFNLKPG